MNGTQRNVEGRGFKWKLMGYLLYEIESNIYSHLLYHACMHTDVCIILNIKT